MGGQHDHVTHLVNLLTFVGQRNEANGAKSSSLFHAEQGEPLRDLVRRLDDNIRCSPSCYAVALVYMDRITETNPDVPLISRTVNLLFTTSLLLANQFLDDKAERALQFARVAGIHPSVMASLKIDFLFRISFSLVVSEVEMKGYSDNLSGRLSTKHFRDLSMWDGILPTLPTSPVTRRLTPFPSLKPPKRPTNVGTNVENTEVGRVGIKEMSPIVPQQPPAQLHPSHSQNVVNRALHRPTPLIDNPHRHSLPAHAHVTLPTATAGIDLPKLQGPMQHHPVVMRSENVVRASQRLANLVLPLS